MARIFAEEEFQQYRSIQDRYHKSDFDQLLEIICEVPEKDKGPAMPPGGGIGGMNY